jgi:GNAT superfamily N-acetyltransferase
MIAPATVEDLPEIIHLQRLAFREEAEHVGDMGIKPMTQTLEELRTELEGSVVLKYVQDGEIVGSVRARMVRGVCAISRLVVRPDHWGRGIGRRLMEEVESRFPDAGRYELFTRVDHERTRPFYRRLGYIPFRTERHSDRLVFVHLYKPGPPTDQRPKE